MNTVAHRLDAAEHLLELGRWQDARPHIIEALATEPDSARALCVLAWSHFVADDGEAMLPAAEAAVAAAPGNVYAHRLHATALALLGRVPEAVEVAEGATRLDPAGWRTHQLVAQLSVHSGTLSGPVRAYAAAKRAIALAPQEPGGWLALGLVYSSVGAQRRARQAAREALRLDPDNPIARHNSALADLNLGRLVKASQGFSAAIGAQPDEMAARRQGRRTAERLLARWAWAASAVSVPAVAAYLEGLRQPDRVLLAVLPLVCFGLGSGFLWQRVPAGIRQFARIGVRHRDLACVVPVLAAVIQVVLTVAAGALPLDLREFPAFDAVRVVWILLVVVQAVSAFWQLASLLGTRLRRVGYWLAGVR